MYFGKSFKKMGCDVQFDQGNLEFPSPRYIERLKGFLIAQVIAQDAVPCVTHPYGPGRRSSISE